MSVIKNLIDFRETVETGLDPRLTDISSRLYQGLVQGEWFLPVSYLNDSETDRREDFRELKSKKFARGVCPWTPRIVRLQRSFRKSVSIYPRSAPVSHGAKVTLQFSKRAALYFGPKLSWYRFQWFEIVA